MIACQITKGSNVMIFWQPVMLIVPDVEDVYTPLQTDLIVPLGEVCCSNSFSC